MKYFFSTLLAAIVLAGCLSGCKAPSSPQPGETTAAVTETTAAETTAENEPPKEFMVEGENYFDYQPGLECSAFSSAYLLRHYGEEADGLELFKDFPAKISGGALPRGIVEFFTNRGYTAEFKTDATIDDIKSEVSKGAPVIVFIHLEEPYTSPHYTHYIPVVGYDEEYFYFAESLTDFANCKDEKDVSYNRKTEIDKFSRLWKDIDATWDNPYFAISAKSDT